jgi:hypothetical protein
MQTTVRGERRLLIEAAAADLAYASVLCWASTRLVATFGGEPLSGPYWPSIPWLRTDTTGILSFALAAVCLVVSKYQRLLRLRTNPPAQQLPERPAGIMAAQSVAETAAILATGVRCLSLAQCRDPQLHAPAHVTHVLFWPSEGTVRVIALIICVVAVAATRYLRVLSAAGTASWTSRSAGPDRELEVLGDGGVRQIQ